MQVASAGYKEGSQRSSSFSYASSTLQNNAQEIVLQSPQNLLLVHTFYMLVPQLMLTASLLINFIIVCYYDTLLSACYLTYQVYFANLLFSTICNAFADVNYIQIQRYLDAQQSSPGTFQFTYETILKIILLLVAMIPMLLLKDMFNSDVPTDTKINQQNMKIFAGFVLFTFGIYAECQNIMLIQHKLSTFFVCFSMVATVQLVFAYLYFLVSNAQKTTIFVLISLIIHAIPLVVIITLQYKGKYSKGASFSFNIKVIFPLRWSMIWLNLIMFLQYLLDYLDIPLLQFLMLYIVHGETSTNIGQLTFASLCLYCVVFNISYQFNNTFNQFLLRFVGINFDYKLPQRILQFQRKQIFFYFIFEFICLFIFYLLCDKVLNIMIVSLPQVLQNVNNFSNAFAVTKTAILMPILIFPYSSANCELKLMSCYKGNLFLASGLFVLLFDTLLIGIFWLKKEEQRPSDIMLYSSIVKFILGVFNHYQINRWLRAQKQSVLQQFQLQDADRNYQIDKSQKVEGSQSSAQAIDVSVQLIKTESLKADSQNITGEDHEDGSTSVQRKDGLRPNNTIDFFASNEISK